jgi:hypothetical protein
LYKKFINLNYLEKIIKYQFVILGISLILFIQTYSIYGINGNESNISKSTNFSNQLETNEMDEVQAQVGSGTTFTITVTHACEFDEGDDPGDFNECLTFPNGATITTDNVHFTARSSLPADQFICTLQREGVIVQNDGIVDNLCQTTTSLTAQATYIDLQPGNYLFIVTAIRNVVNPFGVQEEEESREASYRFTMLGAEGIDIVGNTTSYSDFIGMVSEGKTTFLNVLNIKPHTIIKPNVIACFYMEDEEGSTIDMVEIDCDTTIVFEKNETYAIDSIRSQNPINSSIISTSIQEGIEKPISACAVAVAVDNLREEEFRLKGVKCENLFIAYK